MRRVRSAMQDPRKALRTLSDRVAAYVSNPRAGVYRLTAPLGNERLMRIVTARPVTFADKIRYKMVRDRRRLIGDFADKIEAKKYVARVVGEEFAVDILAVFENAASLRVDGLPEEFVMKVTHGSAGMIAVRTDAPPEARLPTPGEPLSRDAVRPEAFDVVHARAVFAAWLDEPYGARYGEWAYSVHPPRIVVEPMLRTRGGTAIRDVRLHVMNGRVVTVTAMEERPEGSVSSRYLRSGTLLPHVRARAFLNEYRPVAEPPVALPGTVDTMIDVAERVAAETDFLRVDILDLGDRFLVGELTNYPGAGMAKTSPAHFARWLGRQWTLPSSYGP